MESTVSPYGRHTPTISATEMRAINRAAILELIRSSNGISRSQIGEVLDVSLPTVMRIVDDLIGENLVLDTGKKEASGGRKRTLLQFNGGQHLIMGIDLGGTKIYGAIANLRGEILHETTFEHHEGRAEESFVIICQVIDTLLRDAQAINLPLRGIGIGVPGIVQPGSGVVTLAPALQWVDFPLKERLAARYPFPVVIENDVNLAALGEVWFGLEEAVSNLVLLAVGTGIGAGVVINGAVYSGSHHMAGEVGYFIPRREQLSQPYPGFGALEQLASGTGIADQARRARAKKGLSELNGLTAEDVFSAARSGEPWARTLFNEVADYLAQLVAAVALIADPEVILLGGGVAKSADIVIPAIEHRLKGAIPMPLRLLPSRLGYRAAVLGASMLLLRVTSNYYAVHKYG